MEDAKEMLEAAGMKNVKTYDNGYALGMGIHEMGTARMGKDPKSSVVEQAQPGMGCKKCIRDRWCLHDFRSLPESFTHLYGNDRKSSGFCR